MRYVKIALQSGRCRTAKRSIAHCRCKKWRRGWGPRVPRIFPQCGGRALRDARKLKKRLFGRPDLNRASCAQGRRVGRTIICSRHSFDQNLLNSLDSARRRPLMIKLNSRLLTEGLAGASASQIADFLRVRDAYFGALLLHYRLRMRSLGANESNLNH